MYGNEPPSNSFVFVNGASVQLSSAGLNVFFLYSSCSLMYFSALASFIKPVRPASAAMSPLSPARPALEAAINPP